MLTVAEAQAGVISRAQLLAAGLSRSAITRWEVANRLHRPYPNVYALGHRAIEDEGKLRAALLYAGPTGTLSHLTSAWWWQLLDVDLYPIHISLSGERRAIGGLVLHQPRALERTWHRRLPVTPVARTLLDIASIIRFGRLRRALAEAMFLRLVDLDEVVAATGRGRVGSRALRRAAELHRPQLARTRSELEERFLALCEKYAIPLPEVNVTVCGHMVDALWRAERVVIELDGQQAHGTVSAVERDHRRDLDLRAAGYVVRRYAWGQVAGDELVVARDVRATLGLN